VLVGSQYQTLTKAIVDIRRRPRSGAAPWWVTVSRRDTCVAFAWSIIDRYDDVIHETGIHNVLQRFQKTPIYGYGHRQHAQKISYSLDMEFGLVPEICSKQTDRQTCSSQYSAQLPTRLPHIHWLTVDGTDECTRGLSRREAETKSCRHDGYDWGGKSPSHFCQRAFLECMVD